MKSGEADSSTSDELLQAQKRVSYSVQTKWRKVGYFFEESFKSDGSPVILALITHYNEAYIPLYEVGEIMKQLTELHSSEVMKFCIQNCFRNVRMFLRQYHSHLARPRKLRRWPKHKKTHNIGIINEQAVKQLLNWGKSCMQIACNHHFLGSNQFEIQKHARQCQWLVSMAVKTASKQLCWIAWLGPQWLFFYQVRPCFTSVIFLGYAGWNS